jgi:hypothetical protein
VDIKHFVNASKDRTGLFADKPPFHITKETGVKIQEWCNGGAVDETNEFIQRIAACNTMQDLIDLYHANPTFQVPMRPDFEKRKMELKEQRDVTPELSTIKISLNGTQHL